MFPTAAVKSCVAGGQGDLVDPDNPLERSQLCNTVAAETQLSDD